MYTKMDKNTAKKIASEVEAILKKYGAENNLEYRYEGGKYSDTDFQMKLTLKVAGAQSFKDKQAEANLKLALSMYNLTDEVVAGQQIIRFDRNKYKFPVIYRGRDGRNYKTSIEHAQAMFGKKA